MVSQNPESKSVAVELLAWGGAFVPDEIRLNRLVPYLCVLIVDEHESAVVRARAITCMTMLLALVREFPVSEQQIFLHYILPTLSTALKDVANNEIVCVAYAANLGSLAETAQRFLDTGHALKRQQEEMAASTGAAGADGDKTSADGEEGEVKHGGGGGRDCGKKTGDELSYDSDVALLHDELVAVAAELVCHRSAAVKRMVLVDILRLCILVGRERTSNSLLPLIITVLNHRGDWQLRAAFFQHLVGVASFVGRESLKLFILPCILQALNDVDELVVECCMKSLSSLIDLGLLSHESALEAVEVALPLILHPAGYLRLAAIGLVTVLAEQLGPADSYCHLVPLLKPFLKHPIYTVSAATLQDALISPASRVSLELAIEEARRAIEGGDDADADGKSGDPWMEERRKLSLVKAAEEAAALAGDEGDAALTDVGRRHEADMEKLDMLQQHIQAVAHARLLQHKSDEMQVLERRQEQEAQASEEWLQEEWDTFFGGPPVRDSFFGGAGPAPPSPPSVASTSSSHVSGRGGGGSVGRMGLGWLDSDLAMHRTSVGGAGGDGYANGEVHLTVSETSNLAPGMFGGPDRAAWGKGGANFNRMPKADGGGDGRGKEGQFGVGGVQLGRACDESLAYLNATAATWSSKSIGPAWRPRGVLLASLVWILSLIHGSMIASHQFHHINTPICIGARSRAHTHTAC